MRTPVSPRPFGDRSGISLIECLVYMSVLAVLLSVSGFTLAKAWDAHRALSRNANDIHRAMSSGERWRAEIRSAIRPPEVLNVSGQPALRITTAQGVVEYRQFEGALQRRTGANDPWLVALTRVRSSSMVVLPASSVPAWRWELEMETAHKRARLRPLFTFTAVATEIAR